MSLYKGLRTAISSNVTGYSNKVFPLVAPEGQNLPYATYQQTNIDRLQTIQGYTGGLWEDYQISFYNTTFLGARAATDEFIDYIKNFTGTMGDYTIQATIIINEFEDFDLVSSKMRYRVILEIRFYYNEDS